MKDLEILNLNLAYDGQRKIFDDLTAKIKINSINLILGPSGSGKSSLSYCLNGLIPNSIIAKQSGEILLKGQSIIGQEASKLADQIGLVFQDPDTQFATYTVEDELVFGMENLNFDLDRIEKNLNKYLKLLNLEHLRDRSLNALSGGEKQRTAIASILTLEPDIIIFDEPSSNLDVETKKNIFNLISRLKNEYGKTIIIIEHNLEDLVENVDHIIVLNKQGKIEHEGSTQEVLYKLIEIGEQLGITMPQGLKLIRQIDEEAPKHLPISKEEIIEYCVENGITDLSDYKKERSSQNTDVNILTVENLEYRIGHAQILKNINFTVKKKDFLAILGPNGAGKSTLVQLLSGLQNKFQGKIKFNNEDIKSYKKKDLWHKMGLVFQNPEWQFTSYIVEDELLFSLKKFKLTKEEKEEKVGFFLKKFNLENNRFANPYLLSQGQKRRLSVATMLIAGQKLLILDEPTYGQDQQSLDNLLEYIRHLNEEEGITVIIITHDMELVSQYCNRALVLAEGNKIFEGNVKDLFDNKEVLAKGKLSKPFWKEIEEGLENHGI